LAILLKDIARSHKAFFYASLSGMIGIGFMRYNLIHDTQLKPLQMLKQSEYQLPPTWIHYAPSATEWIGNTQQN